MKLLAIETSCDETAVAVVENGTTVIANLVYSQIKQHRPFGGVVPEYAARMHVEVIHRLIFKTLREADITLDAIDGIAVTYGPGLEGALLVGLSAAKTISEVTGLPLIPVHHLHGHIYATYISNQTPPFPYMCLIVSGGHTQLVLIKDHFSFELVGKTRDDAVGEAYDKVAKFLGLSYPGGPVVEKMAKEGNPHAIAFPRAMKNVGLEFSFSGLKTAVIQYCKHLQLNDKPLPVADICASFQEAVCDVLYFKTQLACEMYNTKAVVLTGGVSANNTLRTYFDSRLQKAGIAFHVPNREYCTDNAAMIGAAGFFQATYAKDIYNSPNGDTLVHVTPSAKL